ncbi:hypothetical protein MMA231_02492 [Asticcacaulis sp. MM231]|uniref:hypothetical protein n=1 Tax=Asticcacaulis sp. MM231 TaxID=3157666 RepID=UPI0032D588A8
MKTTIGAFDAKVKTVEVTFTEGKITHTRPVNACLDEDGGYDIEATKARVAEVASGVAAKIAAGVITAQPAPTKKPTA